MHFNIYLSRGKYHLWKHSLAAALYVSDLLFDLVNLRIDAATLENPAIEAQLNQLRSWHSDKPWEILNSCTDVMTTFLGICSELYVLFSLLRGEKGGVLFAAIAAARPMSRMFNGSGAFPQSRPI